MSELAADQHTRRISPLFILEICKSQRMDILLVDSAVAAKHHQLARHHGNPARPPRRRGQSRYLGDTVSQIKVLQKHIEGKFSQGGFWDWGSLRGKNKDKEMGKDNKGWRGEWSGERKMRAGGLREWGMGGDGGSEARNYIISVCPAHRGGCCVQSVDAIVHTDIPLLHYILRHVHTNPPQKNKVILYFFARISL